MHQMVSLITRKQELDLKHDGTSLFLKIMISISTFLFALTLAGVLAINTMLERWNESILGSVTVQIMPINDFDKDKAQLATLENEKKAVEFLQNLDAVEEVRSLSDKELYGLIQPWLGDGVRIDNLPIPRILDVKLKSGTDFDFIKVAEKLAEASPLASLDNHKLWLGKLIRFADGLKLLALVALVMVIIVTSGAIFYTTRTSLGLHREVIEILHQMGAKDTYIAQQYSRRTFSLGFLGGAIGLAFAIPMIFFISGLASHIEGGIISEASLTLKSWIVIISIPIFSSIIAMFTAYHTVKRTLAKMI